MKLKLKDLSFNDEGYHSDALDMSGEQHRCVRADRFNKINQALFSLSEERTTVI